MVNQANIDTVRHIRKNVAHSHVHLRQQRMSVQTRRLVKIENFELNIHVPYSKRAKLSILRISSVQLNISYKGKHLASSPINTLDQN